MRNQSAYDPSLYATTDCLVFKIVETEVDSGDIDNTMYVLYDSMKYQFIVRGQRNPSCRTVFEPYSFRSNDKNAMLDFVALSICGANRVSYSLYNCSNLPVLTDEITIDLLDESCYKANEITGYDNMEYSRKTIQKYIRMVMNVFNPY